uniref:Methyltransf_11 domain-containing protein n=1 Tax=Hydatigena taeniaeformis TaxID=6205 RepID=A0A0R3WJK2_HYDTA
LEKLMSLDTYEVTLLREGFEENGEDGYIRRQCNTVLVRGPCGTMVINPGSPWDGPALIEALKKHGVADPSLVKYVICTDGRATHVGCLSLFTKAEMVIVGHDIQKPGNVFIQHDFMDDSVPFEFDENLSVIGTPGLMDQQVTVFVKGIITPHDSFGDEVPKTPVSIAITGSIFADEEDAARTGVFHGSYFPSDFRGDANSGLSIWRQSRDRLLERSEWIFPAFGPLSAMPNVISAAFARALKSPNMNLPSAFLKIFVFRLFNRPLNRYAVEKCDLKPGHCVLDVGCGLGVGIYYALKRVAPLTISYLRFNLPGRIFGPQWLARLGLAPLKVSTPLDKDGIVHGLDTSMEMVRLSKARLSSFVKAERVVLHHGSAQSIPLQNASVDACFHVDSFYFWPSLEEALEEVLRVLRPGGVVVTTFNPRHLNRLMRWGWMRYARPDVLAYAMTLESVGFCDVEWIKDDPQAPTGVQCIRAHKPPLKLLS